MEYLIMAAASALFVLFIFVLEGWRAKKEKENFIQSLYRDYGKLCAKEYSLERYARMDSFFRRHGEDGQLDDITWNDLGMDALFKRMNYTFSASGEEYLYYALRTLKSDSAELLKLEEVIRFFDGHADERVQVQTAMHRLGYTGKFSLYDYLDNLGLLGERSNRKHILFDLLFLPLIGMLWINFTFGILGIVALTIYNIVSYFKEKGEIDPYIVSFSYIMRLMDAADELEKLQMSVHSEGNQNEVQNEVSLHLDRLRLYRKNMRGLKRNSYWVMSPMRGNSSGNILEAVLDYIRMMFHVDLIKFNSMLKYLSSHVEDVDGMICEVGYLETAIAVGAFRKSLENGYCLPEFTETESFEMTEGYHPMLEAPVKNSIATDRGVLLTGSNASGKSTFLKTVAINAVLAQTIHTCAADKYCAHVFRVYSSMALKDNLFEGESYYIVEIKALKRILDAAASGEGPVLCFVDEVLRGTNTVERIAASTQILNSLSKKGILCFAATHDIELTELLQKEFVNYHFEEDVRNNDVYFNYKLTAGKAVTRNAIKLLELMGYDDSIIQKAHAQAARFMEQGVWKLS